MDVENAWLGTAGHVPRYTVTSGLYFMVIFFSFIPTKLALRGK